MAERKKHTKNEEYLLLNLLKHIFLAISPFFFRKRFILSVYNQFDGIFSSKWAKATGVRF